MTFLGVLRPRHQSQALLVSSAQARQQEVESPTKHLNCFRGKPLLKLEGDCTSLQQAVLHLFCPTRPGTQKVYEGPPPCGPSCRLFDEESVSAGHKEGGLFHRPGAWRAHPAPPLPSGRVRPGLPGKALQPLSCRSLYPGKLEELRHNPCFEGRDATRPGSLLPPHLTALPCSEDIGAAPPPVHRGGTWYTPLPAWLQTEALHHVGPAPHFCEGGLWL